MKDTYRDEDLNKLLARPEKGCDFTEFRSWAMVNFLLNSGRRVAMIRNIQNRDVDLEGRSVIYRHKKRTHSIDTPVLCDGQYSQRVHEDPQGKAGGLSFLQYLR